MAYRRRPKVPKRHRLLLAIALGSVALLGAALIALTMSRPSISPRATTEAGEPVTAFAPSSYWNVPAPSDAPVHDSSDEMVEFLRESNAQEGCVMLVGTGRNDWGTPVYWSEPSDPTYQVRSEGYTVPPEFQSLRIPRSARPAPNQDSELVIYDPEKGHVAHLSKAQYDESSDEWEVTGGSIAYLDSNGLDGRLQESDEERNTGTFRGYNGAVAVVRHDQVAAGAVPHVLKLAVSTSHREAVFPLVGSDGDSTDPSAPRQGARIRIRPDVDLATFDLAPEARVIAETLQGYGAIVADSSGGPIALKLEDTVSEGRGQLWDIGPEALCEIPIDSFEVLEYGYVPPQAEVSR